MASSTPASASGLAVPKGWALTQLAIHEEEVDESTGVPFAGTIMCQLRIDAGGASPTDTLETDLEQFKAGYESFRLLEKSDLLIGATKVPRVIYELVEPDQQQTLRQMVTYFRRGSDLYMLTATHRAGAAFERVKAQAIELLGTLVTG